MVDGNGRLDINRIVGIDPDTRRTLAAEAAGEDQPALDGKREGWTIAADPVLLAKLVGVEKPDADTHAAMQASIKLALKLADMFGPKAFKGRTVLALAMVALEMSDDAEHNVNTVGDAGGRALSGEGHGAIGKAIGNAATVLRLR